MQSPAKVNFKFIHGTGLERERERERERGTTCLAKGKKKKKKLLCQSHVRKVQPVAVGCIIVKARHWNVCTV